MVEGSGLENRRARKGSKGSNPFSSAALQGPVEDENENQVEDDAPIEDDTHHPAHVHGEAPYTVI